MNFKRQNDEDCEQEFCLSSPFQMKDFDQFKLKEAQIQCPLRKEMLGNFSWSVLHTFTFAYPDNPSAKEQKLMKNFFKSFAYFYPCKVCASHFQSDLKKDPPAIQSKKDLVLWLCRVHNKV